MILLVSKRDAIIRTILDNYEYGLNYACITALKLSEEDIIWLKKIGFEVHEGNFVTWRGKFIRWDTVYDLYIDADPPSESNLKYFCDDIIKKIKTHVDNTFAIDYFSETTINFKSKPSYECIKYIGAYFSTLKFHGVFTSYNNGDFSIIKDDPVSLGIGYELKKEEETRCQLKLTWKYGEVFYFAEGEEPMKEEASMKDDVLSAMDAAGLADTINTWNDKIERRINAKFTEIRDKCGPIELIKHILDNIQYLAEEGKYELRITFTDGKLFTEDIKDKLTLLNYKVSIDQTSIKKDNGVVKVSFVNVISWKAEEN